MLRAYGFSNRQSKWVKVEIDEETMTVLGMSKKKGSLLFGEDRKLEKIGLGSLEEDIVEAWVKNQTKCSENSSSLVSAV